MRSFNVTNFEGTVSTWGQKLHLGHCDFAVSTIRLCRLKMDQVQAYKRCGLGKIQKFLFGETIFALRYSAT